MPLFRRKQKDGAEPQYELVGGPAMQPGRANPLIEQAPAAPAAPPLPPAPKVAPVAPPLPPAPKAAPVAPPLPPAPKAAPVAPPPGGKAGEAVDPNFALIGGGRIEHGRANPLVPAAAPKPQAAAAAIAAVVGAAAVAAPKPEASAPVSQAAPVVSAAPAQAEPVQAPVAAAVVMNEQPIDAPHADAPVAEEAAAVAEVFIAEAADAEPVAEEAAGAVAAIEETPAAAAFTAGPVDAVDVIADAVVEAAPAAAVAEADAAATPSSADAADAADLAPIQAQFVDAEAAPPAAAAPPPPAPDVAPPAAAPAAVALPPVPDVAPPAAAQPAAAQPAAASVSDQVLARKGLSAAAIRNGDDHGLTPVVSIQGITKIYQMGDMEVAALRGINVEIFPGEMTAIMGPSGSGKSTLMNVIGCLDVPTSGTYLLDGVDVSKLNDDQLADIRARKIGFVFQSFNLLSRTTALANVELPLIYLGKGGRARHGRAEESLRLVGLGDRLHHKPNELSGGQQQRVAIARALINDPAMILADEPTGNLDSKTSVEIMELFQRLNVERGMTIVFVTHNIETADYCHRVIHVRDGVVERDVRHEPRAGIYRDLLPENMSIQTFRPTLGDEEVSI